MTSLEPTPSPSAPSAHSEPSKPPLAGVGPRFFGRLIDHLLYVACSGIPYVLLRNDHFKLAVVACFSGLLAYFALNCSLLARSGQSLGKRLVGTRIVTEQGGPVPVVRTVLLRSVLPFWATTVPGGGGLFNIIDGLLVFRRERRSLCDLIAGTMVVDAALSERVYAREAAHGG